MNRIRRNVLLGSLGATATATALGAHSSPAAASAAISASDVGFQPASPSTQQRSVESKMRDVVSVKDFGALGDGIHDDSQAMLDALNYLFSTRLNGQNAYGGTLYFPPGEYLCNSQVIIDSSGNNRDVYIRIEGAGFRDTFITVKNQQGWLSLSKSNYGLYFECEGITVLAAYGTHTSSVAHSGSAIQIKQYHSGNRYDRHCIIRDVVIRSLNTDLDYFDFGIRVEGGGRGLFENIMISGQKNNPKPLSWIGTIGLEIFNHYGPLVQHSSFWGFDTACAYHSDLDQGPEGGMFIGCVFDGSRGLYVYTPSVIGEPGLHIDSVHCNCGSRGIEIVNRRYVKMSGCVMYNETEEGEYFDVLLVNVSSADFVDNVFAFERNLNRYSYRIIRGSDIRFSRNRHVHGGLGYSLGGVSNSGLLVDSNELFGPGMDSRRYVLNGHLNAFFPLTFSGVGAPEGVHRAPVGSLYQRLDGSAGSCLYVKESGVWTDLGWVAK